MKNLSIKLFLVFLISFVFWGCEENFSPKTETKETIFLYGILKADDTPYPSTQIAVLTKVYDVDGFDPSNNTIDPTIKDATVTLTIGNRQIVLNQDSIKTNYQNRTKQFFYSTSAKIYSYDSLSLSAKLKNGKTLIGRTRTPKYLGFEFSYPYNHGFTTNLNQVIPVNSWTIIWSNSNSQHLLFPKMLIVYNKRVNGEFIQNSIEVPIKLITRNGVKEPYYATYMYGYEIAYSFEAFDYAMAKLSDGDTDKANYTIIGLDFSIVEFDSPLTSYYSVTNGYLDEYSIRSDLNIYSNVSGGYGIVGAMFTSGFTKNVDVQYISSFGYGFVGYL